MKRSKHFPYLPFLGICLLIIAFLIPPEVTEATASPLYQGEGGAWDTAVKRGAWTFSGKDVVNGDERCQKGQSDLDCSKVVDELGRIYSYYENVDKYWWKRNNPAQKANMFRVTPWVSKLDDSDPYHDWYLLDLKVLHGTDYATNTNSRSTRGGFGWNAWIRERKTGWFVDYREVMVRSGDPQNVFLIDWAPKNQPGTYTRTIEQASGPECKINPKLSLEGPSLEAECTINFSSKETTSVTESSASYGEIKTQLWSPDKPNEASFVRWPEDIKGMQNNDVSTLPSIASQGYESNRVMVWETSQPLEGAELEMYMWAGFEYQNSFHETTNSFSTGHSIITSQDYVLFDRMCLGIMPGNEDHSKGCVTNHEGSQITIVPQADSSTESSQTDYGQIFRLLQYRPPVIPLTQQPTSTTPVWLNDEATVTFDPVKDPDGDYLLYQFDFGDGTFYPASDCTSHPQGDGCQDEVRHKVCDDQGCESIREKLPGANLECNADGCEEVLGVKCDTDGCFGPSLTVQHTWTRSSAADLMGVKAVRVRAAEAWCFPSARGEESPCVKRAKKYDIGNSYNYKSGWSGSFPVTIQGLSSISVEGPVSGDLSDNSTWTMQCQGRWYNQGTPFEEDCSACEGGLIWSVKGGANQETALAEIDSSGLLKVRPLPEETKIDNIMVKASCTDHGVIKTDSISLAIKASTESKPPEEPKPTGIRWEYIAITVLALFALLSWILFGWIGWRWRWASKPKRNEKPHV